MLRDCFLILLAALSASLILNCQAQNVTQQNFECVKCQQRNGQITNCANFPISYHVCKEQPAMLYCPMPGDCDSLVRPMPCQYCKDLNETNQFPKICEPEKRIKEFIPRKVEPAKQENKPVKQQNTAWAWYLVGFSIVATLSLVATLVIVLIRNKREVIHSREKILSSKSSAKSPKLQTANTFTSEAFHHTASALNTVHSKK